MFESIKDFFLFLSFIFITIPMSRIRNMFGWGARETYRDLFKTREEKIMGLLSLFCFIVFLIFRLFDGD